MSTFKDLKVYQIALRLEIQVREIANKLPKSEYKLKSQILNSSRSVRANIVEGYGRKRYQAELCKFLTYSKASSDETQVHLDVIFSYKYVDKKQYPAIIKDYENLSVRILNFIDSVEINRSKK